MSCPVHGTHDLASYGSLPFREQLTFFLRKTNVPTQAWTDLWQADHDAGFMVAGAAEAELLQDLRGAVQAAIVDGESIQQFRKRFDAIVEKYGWAYKGGRNWRTRVIYQTNLRTSYAAGRWAQLTSDAGRKAFPYWRYRHSMLDKVPRPLHITPAPLGWNGLILRADDPWWLTHFPPNGWGCTCYVEGVSEPALQRMGKVGPDPTPEIKWRQVTVGSKGPSPRTVMVPEGIDPGFAYAPGASVAPQVQAWVQELLQDELDSDLATALSRFIARTPPAPATPDAAAAADTAAGAGSAKDVGGAARSSPSTGPGRGGKTAGAALIWALLGRKKRDKKHPEGEKNDPKFAPGGQL